MKRLRYDRVDQALAEVIPDIQKVMNEYGVSVWYIAGGFLRDTLLGVNPKDIDIFIPAAFCGTIHEHGDRTFGREPEAYLDQEVLAVASFHIGAVEIPVECIVLGPTIGNDPAAVMQRFDTNLCKVMADKEGNVTYDPTFLEDIEEKTITVVRNNGADNSRLLERIDRLLLKYPAYTIEDPYELLKDEDLSEFGF